MQKKISLYSKNIFKALVATIFIGGTFHLGLLTITSILKKDLSYINPIDFLGIGYAFPSIQENNTIIAYAWLSLTAVFFVVLYLTIHYQRYLGIVKSMKTYEQIKSTIKSSKPMTIYNKNISKKQKVE